jgi:hypothetical protein
LAQQLFVDGNGVPLAGGQVTLYAPGTQTYATAYSDQQGANPLPNPCTLDADGYPQPTGQMWGSGSYRQVVQDSLGNTIWDNVTSVIAVSSAMLPVLEAPTTAGAAVLLGLGEGVIIPCGATIDGTAIALTRNANTNPVYAAALGTFFVFTSPATATGPFTLSETTDAVPSATLYDSIGNEITQIQENQFCVVGWNPDFGSSGGWVLLFAPQGANTIWTFSSSGTWVCPDGINTVLCSGTGGGGGGGAGFEAGSGGGGGGGAASAQYVTVSVSSGGTYQVTVGAGGTAATGAAGGNGTATTFISSTFATLSSFPGGFGGGLATGVANPPGGAAGGAGGTAGGKGVFASNDVSFGGYGGATLYGSGGAGGLIGTGGNTSVGQTPFAYGTGGGGGANAAGGAGAPGFFLIQIP